MDNVSYIIVVPLAAISLIALGAAIPSLLLWHKARECRHLLNVILQSGSLKPVRASNMAKALGGGDGAMNPLGDKVPVTRTTPPTPIDTLMAGAIAADSEEYGNKFGG